MRRCAEKLGGAAAAVDRPLAALPNMSVASGTGYRGGEEGSGCESRVRRALEGRRVATAGIHEVS